MPGKAPPFSPYSKVKRRLDGRTREAQRGRDVIADLTAHLGGSPSVPQRILIQRIAKLLVVIEVLERRLIEKGEVGDLAGRQYLAWVNSIRLLLQVIGIERSEQAPPRLAEVLKLAEAKRA
jgi:hypothetical protein